MWYNRFKECCEDVNGDAGPGRASVSTTVENVEAVKKLILGDRRITIREVVDDVDISFASCQAIFTNVLCMKYAVGVIVPKLLHFKRTQRRIYIAQKMLTTFDNDLDLLKKFITGDESWVYGYDSETKAQSLQ